MVLNWGLQPQLQPQHKSFLTHDSHIVTTIAAATSARNIKNHNETATAIYNHAWHSNISSSFQIHKM